MKAPRFLPILTLFLTSSLTAFAADGDTQVLKWKDGRKACFLLGFDDSAPSQLKNVVPELQKRKIVGTFYLVTGNGVWAGTNAKWEEASKSPYIVVANHTFTHKGVNNAEELEPGMAFSVEPGIYPGPHGARIEDIVVCTAEGHQRLNNAGRDLIVVAV